MSELHEVFARASRWLWPALADHLWQATLFAALVFALTLCLRRGPARVRYALWLVASAKFVVPSALFALLLGLAGVEASRLFGPTGGAGRGGAALVQQFAGPLTFFAEGLEVTVVGRAAHRSEFYCALSLVWAAGCAALLAAWLVRRREFVRTLRAGREAYAGREFEALERARRRLGMEKEVLLVLSPRRAEPGVWRTRRPVVLVPELIAEQLDDEELESVMLHELIHVERRDNLLSNLQTILNCLLWFHPLVWLMGGRLLAEREQACDERVLEVGGRSDAYASSILKVVRFCSGWRVAGVSGAAAGSNLRRRIEMIMYGNAKGEARRWQRLLPCAAACAALALSITAGLLVPYGGAQAALLPVGDAGQEASAGGQGGGGGVRARTRILPPRGEEGQAAKELAQAPEAVVSVENVAGAPLLINEVRMKLITREQLKRAYEEGADELSPGGDSDEAEFYVTLPTVTLTNVSNRKVREVGISFDTGGGVRAMTGHPVSLKPGESVTINSEWRRMNVLIPGNSADVKLAWAAFADGGQWGGVPRPPRPPHPNDPPPPPGSGARGNAPQAGASSLPDDDGAPGVAVAGTGEGAATASGGGKGVGRGAGVGGGVNAGGGLTDNAVNVPHPAYPAIARAARAQGTVRVQVTVDEEGRVVSARAVAGHPLLQSAAVDAARAAQFKPTFLEGKPVKVSGVISYNFVLDGEDEGKEP